MENIRTSKTTTQPNLVLQPSRNNAKESNTATNAPEAMDCTGTCENTGNNITLPNKMTKQGCRPWYLGHWTGYTD